MYIFLGGLELYEISSDHAVFECILCHSVFTPACIAPFLVLWEELYGRDLLAFTAALPAAMQWSKFLSICSRPVTVMYI